MPMIKNYMEDGVAKMLDRSIDNLECCKCENCRYDIMAIALNSLPPKYVVTRKGEFYAKLGILEQQFDVDIISAITKAAGIVGARPRHNKDDDR